MSSLPNFSSQALNFLVFCLDEAVFDGEPCQKFIVKSLRSGECSLLDRCSYFNFLTGDMPAFLPSLFPRRLALAAFLLGIALGGFFDGILLHQILQWHHLLSGWNGGFFEDVRIQMLADGLFHLLMYVIAVWGLVLLWRNREELGQKAYGKLLLAYAFIGFGAWHILDSVLSHWILGIHRIRTDTDNPLFWDLLWFFVFGVAFILIGWLIHKRSGDDRNSPKPVIGMLVLSVLLLAPLAAQQPAQENMVLVFFRENTPGVEVFRAADAAQARIVWSSAGGNIWAMEVPDKKHRSRLAEHGAYWVVSSPALVGCMAWTTERT